MNRYTFTKEFLTGNLNGLTVQDSFVADEQDEAHYRGLVGRERQAIITKDLYRILVVEVSDAESAQSV